MKIRGIKGKYFIQNQWLVVQTIVYKILNDRNAYYTVQLNENEPTENTLHFIVSAETETKSQIKCWFLLSSCLLYIYTLNDLLLQYNILSRWCNLPKNWSCYTNFHHW